jgi:hypothetical protein
MPPSFIKRVSGGRERRQPSRRLQLYALLMGVLILSGKEVSVSGMGPRSNDACPKDAQTKLSEEESAIGMEQSVSPVRSRDALEVL